MAVNHKPSVLSRIYDWLAVSDPLQKADVIFVLAGRECRKSYGLQLLREGWASTLLLSVDRFEIRRFSRLELPAPLDLLTLASAVEPRRRHFFAKFEGGTAQAHRIAVGRLGTLSEMRAFSHWLNVNGAIRSAVIVSSGFHLRRIRMCCRSLVRDRRMLTFVSVPSEDRYFRSHWWQARRARKLVLFEMFKIAIYWMVGQRQRKQTYSTPVFTGV